MWIRSLTISRSSKAAIVGEEVQRLQRLGDESAEPMWIRSLPISRSSKAAIDGEEVQRRQRLGNSAELGSVEDRTDSWGGMVPELLGEIIRRVEASEDRWPQRQNVVACACVCKKWREVTKEIVTSPLNSHKITFPSNLKQPGPRDFPHQCLISRNKKTSTFYLYLAHTPLLTGEGKFLLAARRYRRPGSIEYVISLDADDISQGSNAYLGKLCSDFSRTKFRIYDSQPPHNGAKPSSSRASRRFPSKQISPQVSAGNFEVGQVSYKCNLLKSRGPRRMACSLNCHQSAEIGSNKLVDNSKMEEAEPTSSHTNLMNKAPRWHEHLQCWCLNFHGRVTVASVKNFQLVATTDQSQPGGKGDGETVLLQFGKVEDDLFTMEYVSHCLLFWHLLYASPALVQNWHLSNLF